MNKTCARCEKTVYPTEELKCLDKVWHKGCFKCQECGMTLNMRTYKGYGKLPYCEAHVPKAKHTTMAETPELKRIAENTKLQSNVKYHADFEKSKGKFTQVADDPETLRIKANTKIISNVAYHGDLEKKAQMERQRQINENGEIVDVTSTDNYQQQIDNYASEMLSNAPPPNLPQKNHYQTPAAQPQPQQNRSEHYYKQKYDDYYEQNQYPAPPAQYSNQQNSNQYSANQQASTLYQTHTQNSHPAQQNTYHSQQYSTRPQHHPNQSQYPSQQHTNPTQPYPNQNQQYSNQTKPYPSQNQQNSNQGQFAYGQYNAQYNAGGSSRIGRIQDYDPLSDGPRAPPDTQRGATLIYNSDANKGAHQHQQQQHQNRAIGRVTDLDPLAAEHQRVYVAMYDYEANDSDEVSFREGDLISNVSSIAEGWMTGEVLRTRCVGMLPSNYVELAPDQR